MIAFESVARNRSFSRAADELRTSQSAVSRQISALETRLSVRLFERSRAGVSLTGAGHVFLEAVVTGLGAIQAGAEQAAEQSDRKQVVIACSHETSHLVLFPRYDALRDALGEEVRIRLLTHQYYSEQRSIDPAADLMLTWNAALAAPKATPEDMALVFREEVQAICSPDYAATHSDILRGPVTGWGGLTFLDVKQSNFGWASWSDWFEAAGSPDPAPSYERFDSYIQVLEATAIGQGIALGCRHYMERYVDSGAVVMLGEGFVEFGNSFVAVLTAKGRRNPSARKYLSFLGQWMQHQAGARRY